MKTALIVCIIVASSLMLLGVLVFGVSIVLAHGDITPLGNDYEEREYEIEFEYGDIRIESDTADIEFVPTDEKKCRVVCDEKKNLVYTVEIHDGVLEIIRRDSRKWYEHINIFSFEAPELTVYIPAGEYGKLTVLASTGDVDIPEKFSFESIDISLSTGDVECYASAKGLIKVKTSTGDIRVENVMAEDLELTVSTGRVSVSSAKCAGDVTLKVSTGRANLINVDCESFTSSGDTGALTLKDVVAEKKISIERSTGDVSFENCDAAEIYVTTDTGDVRGSLLSDKVFMVETDTGDVDVPKSTEGGRCEIKTDTGDVKITVK